MKEIAKIKLYVQFVIQLWLDSGKRLLGLLKLPPEKKSTGRRSLEESTRRNLLPILTGKYKPVLTFSLCV